MLIPKYIFCSFLDLLSFFCFDYWKFFLLVGLWFSILVALILDQLIAENTVQYEIFLGKTYSVTNGSIFYQQLPVKFSVFKEIDETLLSYICPGHSSDKF